MADDLGYGDLGCFGSETIRTPHIDRLAAEGLTFTDYHSNAPVCSPTRAALVTGRYQQRSGLEGVIFVRGETRQTGLDASENSIGKEMKAAGYETAIFGKWHLGYRTEFNPVHHGFDLFRGYVSGNVDYHSHVDNSGVPDWWHNLDQIEEEGYVTDLVSDHAVQFIRDHRDRPFFLYVAHEAPHWPYQGRNDPPDRFPGRDDFPARGSRQDPKGAYKEMIEAMDDGVGAIVQALRELSIDKNTLIIFCSDNGPVADIGSKGDLRGAKGDVFEGGHRVPAIAWWPGHVAPGGVTGETVMSMDWLPTFAALAGTTPQVSKPLDGIDVSGVLLEQAALPERATFFRYRDQAAVRRGNWKLMRAGDQEMLFDLAADPNETTDIAKRHPEMAKALAAELGAWQADVLAGVELRTR